MLYTFSQANYSEKELEYFFEEITPNDYIIFWQDGVLIPIKYNFFLEDLKCKIGILKNDAEARNLNYLKILHNKKIEFITLENIVNITEKYFPQICL